MTKITIEMPTLFGDHHVTHIREILTQVDGIEKIYASSSFRVVEIDFDPETVSEEEITGVLSDSGYLGELDIPVEINDPFVEANAQDRDFRHTEVYENIKSNVSFGRSISYDGRALWPCPGMGVIRKTED